MGVEVREQSQVSLPFILFETESPLSFHGMCGTETGWPMNFLEFSFSHPPPPQRLTELLWDFRDMNPGLHTQVSSAFTY